MVFKERREKKRNNETELNTEQNSEDSIQKSFSLLTRNEERSTDASPLFTSACPSLHIGLSFVSLPLSLVLTHQDRDGSVGQSQKE
jgi:hypothetical protein